MTTAVNLDLIGYNDGDQPLCPSCLGGRLHPYAVTISLARAVGGVHHTSERVDWPREPCGFSMPLTPKRSAR